MTIVQKSQLGRKIEIDLTGPAGNAYCLLGTAQDYYRQLRKSDAEWAALKEDMMSADYEHLVAVFDREFGDFVDLLR